MPAFILNTRKRILIGWPVMQRKQDRSSIMRPDVFEGMQAIQGKGRSTEQQR
jgi:hypothetical protein